MDKFLAQLKKEKNIHIFFYIKSAEGGDFVGKRRRAFFGKSEKKQIQLEKK